MDNLTVVTQKGSGRRSYNYSWHFLDTMDHNCHIVDDCLVEVVEGHQKEIVNIDFPSKEVE